jgi:hypothetical protein
VDGFVELDSQTRGRAWVRLAHITAIQQLEIHDLTGATFHTISVLAGGEWFSDPVPHTTSAAAAQRADTLAGFNSRSLFTQLATRIRRIVGAA